jgi:filamentous hemagglutinin
VILAESAENSNNEKLAKEYIDKAKKWDDGGIYKVALHGAFGATISKLSGYNSFDGFKISAINEVAQPLLRKIDNPDMQKLVSIILGKSISDQSIAAPLINSAVDNNWLTHDDQLNLLRDYRSFKYGEISLDEWVRKLAFYETLMWHEYNHPDIYKTSNATSRELYDKLESDELGSGSFQDVMSNLVYKYVILNGLEDSFYMYKREANDKIISSREIFIANNYFKLHTQNIWDVSSNNSLEKPLNFIQSNTKNESYIMPYQEGISNPDKHSNFRLFGNETTNITGIHTDTDIGGLSFNNSISSGVKGEVSLVRVHHEAQKNAAKVEVNGDILYLAGSVDGALGQGNLYVKAEALAALAAAQGKYSLDFGSFVIIAEGKVYGAGVGAGIEGGFNKEKGTIKIKGDLSYFVGAGGGITIKFKN